MSFEAKYHGKCAACEEHVSPGEEVMFDADDNLVHADCDGAGRSERVTETCPVCWLLKPCGCDL